MGVSFGIVYTGRRFLEGKFRSGIPDQEIFTATRIKAKI